MSEWRPTCREAVAAYLRDGELEGRPAKSIATYRACLAPLRDLDQPLVEVNVRELLHARCAGVSRNTAISIIAAHRSLVRYALDQGWLAADPLRGLRLPKKRDVPHRFLSRDDVARIVAAADDLLDRAALIFLKAGMRAGEACAVRWTDFGSDEEGAFVRVRTEKAGTPRALPVSADDVAQLERLPRLGPTVLECSPTRLWRRITALGRRAGVPCHPHELRHAFAVLWLEAGGDLGTLQTLLGHRSATMTRWYARSALEAAALRKARAVDVYGNGPIRDGSGPRRLEEP